MDPCPCCANTWALLGVVFAGGSYFTMTRYVKFPRTKVIQIVWVWSGYLVFGMVILLVGGLMVLQNHHGLRSLMFSKLCGRLNNNPDMIALRCRLLRKTRGDVLELGPGPGSNFKCFAEQMHNITSYAVVEPNTYFEEALTTEFQDTIGAIKSPAQGHKMLTLDVHFGSAENMSGISNNSIDTVIGTHVLCSVPDPKRVVDEVYRVLRPGGRYYILEHVEASDSWGAAVQGLIAPFLYIIGNGCKIQRTKKLFLASKKRRSQFRFFLEDLDAPTMSILAPHIQGFVMKRKQLKTEEEIKRAKRQQAKKQAQAHKNSGLSGQNDTDIDAGSKDKKSEMEKRKQKRKEKRKTHKKKKSTEQPRNAPRGFANKFKFRGKFKIPNMSNRGPRDKAKSKSNKQKTKKRTRERTRRGKGKDKHSEL